jgi:hypothetical protein
MAAAAALLADSALAGGQEGADFRFAPAGEELRDTHARLQSRCDAPSVQLHAGPKDGRQGRYGLGDEVANLRPAAASDVIVFIRGKGMALTRGKAFLVMIGGGGSLEHSMQSIRSFADARSGVIPAHVEFLAAGDYVNQTEERTAKPLAKMLKKNQFTAK